MKNFRNVILDASSLIAFVYAEPGYEVVADILHCSVMSTVNVSEVIKYMLNCNVQKEEIDKLLDDSLSKIIDFNRRQVYKADERIRLTGMEFSLLELLISRSGQAFSRSEILQEVWGYTPERHVDTRVVDVHISRLRAKLEIDPSNPDLILTARGTGYLFQRIVSPNSPL